MNDSQEERKSENKNTKDEKYINISYIDVIHQNVQSLGNAVNAVNDLLSDQENCKILCVTEHWKSEEELKFLALKNFKLSASFCREAGRHGGSAVYVHKNVRCKKRNKIINLSVANEFECSAVECDMYGRSFIIISIYRPPTGDINIFLQKVEALLISISEEKKGTVIAGDFNIEMLLDTENKTNFLSLLNSFGMHQTIFLNTRVTHNSASCIDNIFVNFEYVESNVIPTFISDHTAQKITFHVRQKNKNTLQYRRIFSQDNKLSFIDNLKEQDWLLVYEVDERNVNEQWNTFMNYIVNIFNLCFPLKLINNKHKKKINFNDDRIRQCKNRLDILLTLSTISERFRQQYKNVKKEYDSLLQLARSEEYDRKLKSSDNKPKCMWSIYREITGNEKITEDIGIEGRIEEIPDMYNQYLISIVPELVNQIKCIPTSYNIPENNQSIFLRPISEDELCAFAKKIKNKHSSGVDEIPTSLMKLIVPAIKTILCYIVNNGFKHGIFPQQLKIALIKPLLKKGDPSLMENYRPINLLPAFSKLFEIAMCDRLVAFMQKCQLFNNNQHGYVSGKSTQTAIFQFVKSILNFIERGDIAMGLCLDLSKAYDCVDPDILLNKLELYGVRGNAFKLWKSYLSDRQQKVKVIKEGHTHFSSSLTNKMGIAQGSIAGPILFVIFLNDLNSVARLTQESVTCYADDTNLITGENNVNDLVDSGTALFNRTNNWFLENRLLLNKSKTNILIFRTKQSKIEKPEKITLDETDVEVSEQTKFLGIHLDEFLDWSKHINVLLQRLNSTCYGIRIVAPYMNDHSLKVLYHANFESVLKYGIIFWGRNRLIEKVFVTQKRVLRIIKRMSYKETCRSVFKFNRILTVYGMYIYECLIYFHKNKDMFELQTHHNYNTRTINVNYPIHRLTLTERNPCYMCLKLFNCLPNDVKTIESLGLFKRKVRTMLIELEPYSLNDFLN